ncbi:MAG: hypothetical protein ACE5HQ_08015 [Gemmatimonadota bacterium]
MENSQAEEKIVPPEVMDLLEERSRIEAWLARLQELEADATPAVYEKVRSDYRERLSVANARLTEHQAELESSVAERRSRVDGLRADRERRAGELEEAKLRYTVGEFEEADWERRRTEAESALEELDQRLESASQALHELEGVLAALASSGTGSPSPAAGEWTDIVEPAAPGASPGDTPDELAATDEGAAEESPAELGAVDDDGAGSEAENDGYLDELEFLESLSLEDSERFDAVSLMLDEEAEAAEKPDEAADGKKDA